MMRSSDILFGLEDIAILQQYLYLDPANTIQVKNSINVPLEFSMNDDGIIMLKNLNFPDNPAHKEDVSIPTWLAIIDQLKEQPLKNMADWTVNKEQYKTRWDEIVAITKINVDLNRQLH